MTAAVTSQKQEIAPKKKSHSSVIAPLVTILAILLIWQFLVIAFHIPAWKIPTPGAAIQAMFTNFGELAPYILSTYLDILVGFLIAVVFGIVLACLISNFNLLGIALTPYINLLCTTPLITLVPLLMLWLGFGNGVKILAVVVQAFPIVNMNSLTGFNNVEMMKLELMQSLRASRIQTFRYCVLPNALPSVFTGMKLSGILATIACVTTEMSGGNNGLGYEIVQFTQYMKMDEAFACIFYVAVIGILLYSFSSLLESRVIKWKI